MAKKVLVIYGPLIGTREEIESFWNKIIAASNEVVEIEYQDIKSFQERLLESTKFAKKDLIILNAHGSNSSPKAEKPRDTHTFLVKKIMAFIQRKKALLFL